MVQGGEDIMLREVDRLGFLRKLIVIGILGSIVPMAWSMDESGYKNISVGQFVTMMGQKDFVLINVHIPYRGEIPKTDLLIPFNTIEQQKSELPTNKDTKIVVYCRTGPMGHVAAEKMVRMGYTEVIHFKGGMKAWEKIGRLLLFKQ
jgi:rhodanese-related sulfurtransferase